MRAMVLAAGLGSRLSSKTGGQPKPLVDVGGQSVISRNLLWLASHGVDEVVVNLHHQPELVEAEIGDGGRFGLRVTYSREEILRGTAGALGPVREQFADAPFLVVYGDNLFDFDLGKLRASHADNAGIATLALFSTELHEHTGIAGGRVEMDRSGRILRFVEGRLEPGLDLVNAGCYVVEPGLLQHIPEPTDDRPFDFGHDLFPFVLRNGGILAGHVLDGRCLAIDTPEALERARAMFAPSPRGEQDPRGEAALESARSGG